MLALGHVAVILSLVTNIVAIPPLQLVPSKRAVSLTPRSYRHDVTPKDAVNLHYGTAPLHPPSAVVTLSARDDRPILLLEDLDHLLRDLTCYASGPDSLVRTIVVNFAEYEIFGAASEQWISIGDFSIITAHPGCNTEDQRGVWSVSSVTKDVLNRRLALTVEAVTMRDVTRSFAIKYSHNSGRSWSMQEVLGLTRRDEQHAGHVYNFPYSSDIDARLPLLPPNMTLNPRVSQTLISNLRCVELDVNCIDCKLNTNVTVGLNFDVDVSGPTCILDAKDCFTLKKASVNFTVEAFELDTGLEVTIGKQLFEKQVEKGRFKILQVPLPASLFIPSIIEIGPSIGVELAFELDVSSSVNFTFGTKGQIPSGAFASVSLVDADGNWDPKTSASGWDGAGLDKTPLRVNSGQFDISSSIALAPYAEVSFSIFDVGAALRLVQNAPKAIIRASMQESTNRDCKPVGEDDFESFGTTFSVSSGLSVGLEAELVVETGKFPENSLPDSWNSTLYNVDLPFESSLGIGTTSCFILTDGDINVNNTINVSGQGSGNQQPGHPASTGTLFSAQSAVPTWNISKIESYYSASGQLPTNVNYAQMVQATTVPADLLNAINRENQNQNNSDSGSGGGGNTGGASQRAPLVKSSYLCGVPFILAGICFVF